MDQSGEVLPRNGLAENKLLQGVTTAIAGEGGTPVPAEQIADYFQQLETKGIALNFGTYYSSAQARVAAMGDGAGAPTPAQLAKMKELVGTAMRAGTVGIATALIYRPDSFQSTQDLIELIDGARSRGVNIAADMYLYTAGGTGLDITVPNWVFEQGAKQGPCASCRRWRRHGCSCSIAARCAKDCGPI
jgi:N-acyl-D-amino-acid deacylase